MLLTNPFQVRIIPKLLGKIVVSIKFLKLTINELAYDVTTKNMNPYK